jgi:hypothetical protein
MEGGRGGVRGGGSKHCVGMNSGIQPVDVRKKTVLVGGIQLIKYRLMEALD